MVNQQVVQDLRGRIQRLPNFQRNVIAVRRQLMGVATTPEHKRYVKAPHNHKHKLASIDSAVQHPKILFIKLFVSVSLHLN